MEIRNYLNEITLKLFLFLLYGSGAITLPSSQYEDSMNFIRDIAKYKLQKFFTLKINDEIFNDEDCEDFLDKEFFNHSIINNPLSILLSEIYKNKLIDFIENYISDFKSGNFDSVTDNYYTFNRSLFETTKKLNSFSDGINKEFSIKILLDEDPQDRFCEKENRFFEIIFYLDLKKIVSINGCSIIKNFDNLFKEKQKLDLRLSFIKDATSIIDSFEGALNGHDDTMLELHYDEYGNINISDGERIRKLSSPRYNSINMVVFEYLYNNHDKPIKKYVLSDLVQKELGKPLTKPLRKIAQELGFTGDIKKIFFITTEKIAKLRKKITKSQLNDIGIDISKIFS